MELDDVWFAYPSRPNNMVLKVFDSMSTFTGTGNTVIPKRIMLLVYKELYIMVYIQMMDKKESGEDSPPPLAPPLVEEILILSYLTT